MNKNIILIIVTLAAGLAAAGCNKAGKLNKPSTLTTPSGPVELKAKWPPGERVVQTYDMKINTEISIPGQPNPIKQDTTMGQRYGLTVVKAEADGGREVEMEFLAMRMKLDQGGKTLIDYDSDTKAATGPKQPELAAVEEMLQNVIGAKIQLHLDASNNVARVEGVDQLMNRLATRGPAVATDSIRNMFSEDYLKQMMGNSRYLPPKPVQPGDTWPVQTDLEMGNLGTLALDYHLTFQSWEKRGPRLCARLESEGTIKSRPGANPDAAGTAMTIQDGSSSGVSWFDPELGMVIDSVVNQDIKMTMSLPVPIRGKTVTQTLTNLMHQVITMKVESVK